MYMFKLSLFVSIYTLRSALQARGLFIFKESVILSVQIMHLFTTLSELSNPAPTWSFTPNETLPRAVLLVLWCYMSLKREFGFKTNEPSCEKSDV